jgi:quercetin dioxygenase-like cupin family protein
VPAGLKTRRMSQLGSGIGLTGSRSLAMALDTRKARGFDSAELAEAWIDGQDGARWRSTQGHGSDDGAALSGSSLLEIGPGCRLPRHTDSAEEVIVVVAGSAAVTVDGEAARVEAGGVALVPECATHEVRNAGEETLRFVAVYASTDVVTTYEDEVQPEGSRERRPVD